MINQTKGWYTVIASVVALLAMTLASPTVAGASGLGVGQKSDDGLWVVAAVNP